MYVHFMIRSIIHFGRLESCKFTVIRVVNNIMSLCRPNAYIFLYCSFFRITIVRIPQCILYDDFNSVSERSIFFDFGSEREVLLASM